MNERQTYSTCTANEQVWHDVCNTNRNQLNTYNMKRVHNTILSALIITSGVSIIGITQSHTWEQLSMFAFGAGISLFMIGLIATEK